MDILKIIHKFYSYSIRVTVSYRLLRKYRVRWGVVFKSISKLGVQVLLRME